MQSKISTSIIKNSNLVTDAPNDGKAYVRQNGVWVDIRTSGILPETGGSNTPSTPTEPEWTVYNTNFSSKTLTEFSLNISSLLGSAGYINVASISGTFTVVVASSGPNPTISYIIPLQSFTGLSVGSQTNLKDVSGLYIGIATTKYFYVRGFSAIYNNVPIFNGSVVLEQPESKKRWIIN